jgi:diacylglycerol O-acyltransferase
MEQLSSIDAAYIYAENPKRPMHVTTATIYDPSTAPQGKVRLKEIMGLFERAVYSVPMFRQRLVEVPMGLDEPYWIEDPDFDIEYHVRHVALPKPGDWRQFYIQVARINTRRLDRTRPLWEVYVIEGLNHLEGVPAHSFAIVMKLHYAALNGDALRSLFRFINTTEPQAPPSEEHLHRTLYRDVRRGSLPLLYNAWQHGVTRSLGTGKVLGDLLRGYRGVRRSESEGKSQPLRPIPETRFNAPLSPHRVVTSYSLPFARARELKQAVKGATLNELMLSIIAGAMRHYLSAKAELADDSLIAQATFNVMVEDNGPRAGKKETAVNIALCTDIEDPEERLYAIHDEAIALGNYLKARGEHLAEDVAETIHPLISRGMQRYQEQFGQLPLVPHLYPSHANTLVRNMPGPRQTVYLCGAKIVTSMSFAPCMPKVGLAQTITSTAGQLVIAVNADRKVMPDPEFYRECLKRSWLETEIALEQRLKPRQKPAKQA